MAKSKGQVVAEICLYGDGGRKHGTGWLASMLPVVPASMLGNGNLVQWRNYSAAVWCAADALFQAGARGQAWVYEAGGKRKALIDLGHPGNYGDLKWQPAEVYVISAEEIERVAAEQEAARKGVEIGA